MHHHSDTSTLPHPPSPSPAPPHPEVVARVKLVGLCAWVGDEALLVQLLGVAHDALAGQAQVLRGVGVGPLGGGVKGARQARGRVVARGVQGT